jgi:hypothetical protein
MDITRDDYLTEFIRTYVDIQQDEVVTEINRRFPGTTNVIIFSTCAVAPADVRASKYGKSFSALTKQSHWSSNGAAANVENNNEDQASKNKETVKLATAPTGVPLRKFFQVEGSNGNNNGNNGNNDVGLELGNQLEVGGPHIRRSGLGLMSAKPEPPPFSKLGMAREAVARSEEARLIANAKAKSVAAATSTNLRSSEYVLANACEFKYFLVSVHGILPTKKQKPIFKVPKNTIVIQTGGAMCGMTISSERDAYDQLFLNRYLMNKKGLTNMFQKFLGLKGPEAEPLLDIFVYNVQSESANNKILSLDAKDLERTDGYWGVYMINPCPKSGDTEAFAAMLPDSDDRLSPEQFAALQAELGSAGPACGGAGPACGGAGGAGKGGGKRRKTRCRYKSTQKTKKNRHRYLKH